MAGVGAIILCGGFMDDKIFSGEENGLRLEVFNQKWYNDNRFKN